MSTTTKTNETLWFGEADMCNDDEIRMAFDHGGTGTAWDEVAEVERAWVVSPEGGGSVDLVALGTLIDGRWFALEAWADYTGWGCQDGADLTLRRTRDEVLLHGLTEEGRRHLELPTIAEESR